MGNMTSLCCHNLRLWCHSGHYDTPLWCHNLDYTVTMDIMAQHYEVNIQDYNVILDIVAQD